jgi:hypothetical protein
MDERHIGPQVTLPTVTTSCAGGCKLKMDERHIGPQVTLPTVTTSCAGGCKLKMDERHIGPQVTLPTVATSCAGGCKLKMDERHIGPQVTMPRFATTTQKANNERDGYGTHNKGQARTPSRWHQLLRRCAQMDQLLDSSHAIAYQLHKSCIGHMYVCHTCISHIKVLKT